MNQEKMKPVYDGIGTRDWEIRIGDFVRVIGHAKQLRYYDEVLDVGENSVTLKVWKKCPIDRVTQRTDENDRRKSAKPRLFPESLVLEIDVEKICYIN